MLTVAVCDDNAEFTEYISRRIQKLQPDCAVRLFCSGEALTASGKRFDIIFLDVKMNGMSGLATAEKIRGTDPETIIIFISGIRDHVFDAFDVDAFQYLLKPVDDEKFGEVFLRAVKKVRKRYENERRRLFIRTKGKSVTLYAEDIIYLENEMRKIAVHTRNEVVTFYGAMSKVAEQLGDDFYRCHRGYLVNLAFVAEYDSENIYLENGEKIYMAREKYQDFVKSYMRFLRRKGAYYV